MTARNSPRIEISTQYTAQHELGEDGEKWIRTLQLIRFADPKCGWALGGGQLLRTIDGGLSWRNHYPKGFKDEYLGPQIVHPVDFKRCWLLATYASHEARCFLSEDSGSTWHEKYRLFAGKFRILHLDCYFFGRRHGWILCGEEEGRRNHVSIHLTSDAGRQWSRISLKLKGRPRKIVFQDAKTGWLIETNGKQPKAHAVTNVHYTHDGGFEWDHVAQVAGEATSLIAPAPSRLFITGWNGLLARSADGGRIWERIHTGTQSVIESAHFCGSVGLATGSAGTVHSRRSVILLLSRDAGITWKRMPSPTRAALFGVYLTAWDRGVLASPQALYRFKLH